jgi:hypothetical protein
MQDFLEIRAMHEANIRHDGWTKKDFTEFKNAKVKLLKTIATVFAKHNVKWHPDSGTLLGIYRNESLLDTDNDVDISIRAEDVNADFFLAIDELVENKDLIVTRPCNKEFKAEFEKGYLVPDDRWYKVEFVERTLDKLIFCDILMWFPYKDIYFAHDGKVFRHKAENMQKFSNIVFKGINMRIPKNTEAYLETIYTEDWKTPNSKWREDTDMWHVWTGYKKELPKDYKYKF